MTADELRVIVKVWGGVRKFSELLRVRPRTVYYWLSGDRKISPMVAAMIRLLR